ncbi:MAG: aldehyde ferredoxin oxidoreductase N-terminal domain-containing protein [Syntrophorhabdus sp.]
MIRDHFRVLVIDLNTKRSRVEVMGGRDTFVGGSGLAAELFRIHGIADRPWNDPGQPVIFAIGPLTGYFPLMSKTVCAFKSPYHNQYAESHGGGRSAFALRFADYDALVIKGRAKTPSSITIGSRNLEVNDVSYLWGKDIFETGKMLRSLTKGSGHRSILRIGLAGEMGSAMAEINVDTYRHFGRLGGGTAMGNKNLKAIVISGDGAFKLPDPREYQRIFQDVYKKLTDTTMMSKYHDIGTPINVAVLNELQMLPIHNLQRTTAPGIPSISGEAFAEKTLLRNTACAGCPVGCIHIGFVREQFHKEHRYLYRQVSYDHEPIFAVGAMLSVMDPFEVLAIIDVSEKMGLDVMSAGVALAWATEACEKGVISEKETLVPLAFGETQGYKEAMQHLGRGTNDFYRLLAQGTQKAVQHYGGGDYACVLGQEMAGYATGEVFFVAQALGLRHSHLDSGGYAYDQVSKDKDVQKAVDFLVKDEQGRVLLTSMVSCLFARGVYTDEVLKQCLASVGYNSLADSLGPVSRQIQKSRWKMRFATGFVPEDIVIPKRFYEIATVKGPIDRTFLDSLAKEYTKTIREIATKEDGGT